MATDAYTARRSGLLVPRGFSQVVEAAQPSRRRRPKALIQKDSKKVLTGSVLRMLRSNAREIFINSGLVRGAFLDVARYLVGLDGIVPQAMTADPGWNQEIEYRWWNWLNIADLRRKMHLNQIVRSASVEMDIDGDFGMILTQTGGGDLESPGMLQLQTVRAHRIDDPPEMRGKPNANVGVIEDRVGRVRGYQILNADGAKERVIPASSFILLGDPDLSDYSRYPSAITHGINTVQDSREIMGFVSDGIKNRTARAFWRKTPTGEVEEGEMDEELERGDDLEPLALQDLLGGEIPILGPGEELHELGGDYPGNAVMPHLEFSYRDFATGYGTPLEVIWKGDLGGPAQRFFLGKFQRRVDERRGLVFVPHMLKKVYSAFVAMEVQRKAIRFREDWWKHRWVPTSPKVTIDMGREAQQNREDLLLGTRTLQEDAGERGLDWEELRDQVERETDDLVVRAKKLQKKHDITFEQALSLLSQRVSGSQYLNLTELLVPKEKPVPAKPAKPLKE
jgi:capsid protein